MWWRTEVRADAGSRVVVRVEADVAGVFVMSRMGCCSAASVPALVISSELGGGGAGRTRR